MNNLFYFNITYKYNNKCKDCCSHNTRDKNKRTVSVDDIKVIDDKFKCTESDVWVISGGEPTVADNFDEIINYCLSKSKHIILYTNGRNLHKINAECFERIIVPLYGTESGHNDYVGSSMAYSETVNALTNIIERNPDKIELKLLINDLTAMKDLLQNDDWQILKKNNRFSISRVIKPNVEIDSNVLLFTENLIMELLSEDKTVKFYDLPFCKFSEKFQNNILDNYDCSLNSKYRIICGSQFGKYTVFGFNKRADYYIDCSTCNKSIFCTKIMQRYYCPVLTTKKCWIGTE